ncbi:MAG: single-stranded DNA-binding protein [Verrucomicrobiales bacterium]|jgi:spoIIIJ-associated protein|nr:single-stranded DNA-binding protein [Verrucomicrobiales bacterium]
MASGYTPKETLERMLEQLGFTAEVREEPRAAGPTLHIFTAESARLIGKGGKTLDDLQYLLNHVISSGNDDIQRVIVDVENYRQEQHAALLKKLAEKAAHIKATGEEVVLPPMNSFDRRLVHHHFANDPDIASVSEQTTARLKRITLKRRAADNVG